MTDKIQKRLEEMLEVIGRATPGEWFVNPDDDYQQNNWLTSKIGLGEFTILSDSISSRDFSEKIATMKFIAQSRTDWEKTVKALRWATLTLRQIKSEALQGDETSTELNCHHLAEDALKEAEDILCGTKGDHGKD